ncbi:MAG: 3-isopropylmalate dehydratase small subunit, partial [Myxococcota bacterium]|nr:3-isopropylmalate dehydratase small subunit [Myxococcota bacterium]
MEQITEIGGRGCVMRGDDIDTDRIIPARFMKVITFDDMGLHCFEDDRKSAKGNHALDDERYAGAEILVVGKNFGCGSSREHAPQSLMRFGFRGFIGESFAEIFAGNCTSLGLVCLTLPSHEIENLRESIELDPEQEIKIDVADATVSYKGGRMQGDIPPG